ncbi:MAG: metallophosphoesterase family protein [Candidatus Aminicenantes bacterium]|nr:metallophosphoesterase family protein [Candidatus Aminicenantes bacterium]
MRFLIFSDIHGNIEALNALLRFAAKRKIDHYVFLGDLVGYGASPDETIQKVRALRPLSILRGNHDKAVSGQDSIETFNPIAASAINWTRAKIKRKNVEFLTSLRKGPLVVHDGFAVCHGAPFDEDYYIFGEFDAAEAFEYLSLPLCFFGHTHFPYVYTRRGHKVEGTLLEGEGNEVKLEKGATYLINPGSVGQPRDRNPKAALALYDDEARLVKFFRLEYDIEEARRKILAEKLPPALAERLTLGI